MKNILVAISILIFTSQAFAAIEINETATLIKSDSNSLIIEYSISSSGAAEWTSRTHNFNEVKGYENNDQLCQYLVNGYILRTELLDVEYSNMTCFEHESLYSAPFRIINYNDICTTKVYATCAPLEHTPTQVKMCKNVKKDKSCQIINL